MKNGIKSIQSAAYNNTHTIIGLVGTNEARLYCRAVLKMATSLFRTKNRLRAYILSAIQHIF